MTDEEYRHFLAALARKHLRYSPPKTYFDLTVFRRTLLTLKLLRERDDPLLVNAVINDLAISPVTTCTELMEESGIFGALDEAHELVLSELRSSCIPAEDADYLRAASLEEHEIEVLLALAIRGAHAAAGSDKLPSRIAADAETALSSAVAKLQALTPGPPGARAKRKCLNAMPR